MLGLGLSTLAFVVLGCHSGPSVAEQRRALRQEGTQLLGQIGALRASSEPPRQCPDEKIRALQLQGASLEVALVDARILPTLRDLSRCDTDNGTPIVDLLNSKEHKLTLADRSMRLFRRMDEDVDKVIRALASCSRESKVRGPSASGSELEELKEQIERARARRFIGLIEVGKLEPARFISQSKQDPFAGFVPGRMAAKVTIFDRERGEALCRFELETKSTDRVRMSGVDEFDDRADEDLVDNWIYDLEQGPLSPAAPSSRVSTLLEL
ncbi:Hypothetical protein A7982_08190 [Minicystis rosea]|nr:Hypothetical protein A7982_08190 [Minicystis rosea]